MTAPTTFARDLVRWARTDLRDLPWRRTRDPWAILVAETMLQQTQVSRVVPRWTAFLGAFPTPRSCAAVAVGEVVRWWDGLGYNRRAVNLHRAATAIADRHDGQVPDDLDALLALPGVGPYTARAIRVFAFERDDHGVVDTNVARVLARAVAGRSLRPAEAQRLADGLVPAGDGWLWNQAVMELGARFCRTRTPACDLCPVASGCAWHEEGSDAPDPAGATAFVSGRQSRFEGSDRQGRGRLVAALRTGPVAVERIADAAGWGDDPDRARRIADGLVVEGLAEYVDGVLVLPT